jgi:hypothetical protein
MSAGFLLPEQKKRDSRCLEILMYPINHALYVIMGFVITDKFNRVNQTLTQLFYFYAYSKERVASSWKQPVLLFRFRDHERN